MIVYIITFSFTLVTDGCGYAATVGQETSFLEKSIRREVVLVFAEDERAFFSGRQLTGDGESFAHLFSRFWSST